MKRHLPHAFAALALAAFVAPHASAGTAFRAYLSVTGVDNPNCTVSQPCRLLPAALTAVASGGEIWILDSANFNQGQVDIPISVSILAVPGATASFVSLGSFPALTITTPGIKVALRNVVVTNYVPNPGTYGVQMTANSELSIEDSLLSNMVFDAINVTAGKVSVRNSVFRDNGNFAVTAYSGASVSISNSQLFGGYGGVDSECSAGGTTTVINITDSTLANQTQFGAHAVTTAGTAKVLLTRSTVYNVGTASTNAGLYANSLAGTPMIVVANSTVSGNYINFQVAGTGVIKSLGNNYIGDGSAADVGSLTSLALR